MFKKYINATMDGQSAAKFRIGKRSTTIPQGSTTTSDW